MKHRIPRQSRIIATLGPASYPDRILSQLIDVGVDVFRVNFSHGSREENCGIIDRIRANSGYSARSVGILADLCGPKIRVGVMTNDAIVLINGATTIIQYGSFLGTSERIPCRYAHLAQDIRPNDRIMLDDGALELRAQRVDGDEVHCVVVRGGTLKNRKGMNLPGVNISEPSVTEKDRLDLLAAIDAGADMVAISFVRTPDDVALVRSWAEAHSPNRVILIAKIERPEAVENMLAIIDAADGIMVARGDLGVEMDLTLVPIIQKQLILEANARDKIVITATQMLESMTHQPSPTRAEVSDVANAILDGTDAIMLSGETATGDYPVITVRTMAEIALTTERSAIGRSVISSGIINPRHRTLDAVGQSIMQLARDLEIEAIIAYTDSGKTATFLSKSRPQAPIYAFTPNPSIARRMTLLRGVIPICRMELTKSGNHREKLPAILLEQNRLQSGDRVLFVSTRQTSSGNPADPNVTIDVLTIP
jgi:pyruvate kinase